MNYNFYKELTPIKEFGDIFGKGFYTPFPESWIIVLTDVVDSTKAIEAGKYKEVNTAGSLPAMALSNLFGDMDFPFFFGGDGMTCILPDTFLDSIKDVLFDTGQLIKSVFDLDLRLGIVPLSEIYNNSKTLSVARWKISDYYYQAVLDGDGLDYAENLVKSFGTKYLIPEDHKAKIKADLSGYTCRWQDFKSNRDETIALLIKFKSINSNDFKDFYREILGFLGEEKDFHPLQIETSKFALKTDRLNNETGVIIGKTKGLRAFLYRQWMRFLIIGSAVLGFLKLPFGYSHKKISKFKEENIISSDFRKYDNSLKMVVSINTDERKKLEKFLEDLKNKGLIYYGIHISDRALLTCLLHTKSNKEVHFVDAADGGYAYAAKQIKSQIKEGKNG